MGEENTRFLFSFFQFFFLKSKSNLSITFTLAFTMIPLWGSHRSPAMGGKAGLQHGGGFESNTLTWVLLQHMAVHWDSLRWTYGLSSLVFTDLRFRKWTSGLKRISIGWRHYKKCNHSEPPENNTADTFPTLVQAVFQLN